MGQTSCSGCSNKQVENFLINEVKENNLTKSHKFDGNLFNKNSIKETLLDRNMASLKIQSNFRSFIFRRFFKTKLQNKLKIESNMIIEMVKDNLTPKIIFELKKHLNKLDLETYYEANNSYSVSLNNCYGKDKIVGSYLILYKNTSKLKVFKNKSNLLLRNSTKFTINKSATNSSNGSTSNTDMNTSSPFQEDYTSYYYGEVNINNERHGYGEFLSDNKTFYIGYWIKNKFEGFGTIIDAKGFIYEGKF